MVNKPKAIGTAAETAVKRELQNYWPTADRTPLRGNRDTGDIQGTGEFIWEVKGGNAARGPSGETSPGLIATWLAQTEVERVNAKARFGVLVVARPGVGHANVRRWWAWMPAAVFAEIMGASGHQNPASVRLELGAFLDILADQGFTPDVSDQDEPEPDVVVNG